MRLRLLVIPVALVLAGCQTGTTALWRAGAALEVKAVDLPRTPPSKIEVFFKTEFGALEETESEREFACRTTRVLRKSSVVSPGWISELKAQGLPAQAGDPSKSVSVLAHVTTEEYPRAEEGSQIKKDNFSNTFGFGTHPQDLWTIKFDPGYLREAVDRLRVFAAKLGADAVIDVFVTGEAEHHMWEGGGLSLDPASTSSPFFVSGKLMQFRLRDCRLHGTAVRYD